MTKACRNGSSLDKRKIRVPLMRQLDDPPLDCYVALQP
jgi:hypothetical protein